MPSLNKPVTHSSNMTFTAPLAMAWAFPVASGGQGQSSSSVAEASAEHGHYAEVNGIKLYYEIHSSGQPLVLLHGGLGAIQMFGPNLTALASTRQVIAVTCRVTGVRPTSIDSSESNPWRTISLP